MHADHKKPARLAIMADLLRRVAPPEVVGDVPAPDPGVLFPFDPSALEDGRLAR